MERPIKGTKLIGWKEILELKKESQLIKAPLKSSGQAIYWSTNGIWKMGYFGKTNQSFSSHMESNQREEYPYLFLKFTFKGEVYLSREHRVHIYNLMNKYQINILQSPSRSRSLPASTAEVLIVSHPTPPPLNP